ncbi:MAG: sulfotransferase family protein [Rubrobacter sp.]
MKVIGAGFGRTGTTSLKAALDRLGFGPTYHMEEVMKSPRNSALWSHYLDAECFDWDEVFRGYGSAVDWPASAYYRELAAKYPEAKIILTVRDPESWYESASKTIYAISAAARRSVVVSFGKIFVAHLRNVSRLTDGIIWDGVFDGRFEDREHAISRFLKNTEEVRRTIPPERLLVYEVREGWGPLCEFLGLEGPDESFPRLNDTKSFRRGILALRVTSAVVPVSLVLGGGYAMLRAFKK